MEDKAKYVEEAKYKHLYLERAERTHNSTFAKGLLSCLQTVFTFTGSSVLQMSIFAEKPTHNKSSKG